MEAGKALTLPQPGDPVRYYRNGWHFGHVLEVNAKRNEVWLPHPRSGRLKRVKRIKVPLSAVERTQV